MSGSTLRQPVSLPMAVTAQHDFCNATPGGEKLFSVRGGVPLRDAFDQLSVLLRASMETVEFAATEGTKSDEVPGALWQSVHLMNFTYALVQSMQQGLIHHEKR